MKKVFQAALIAAVTLSSGVAMAQDYAPIPPPQVEAGPPPEIPGPPAQYVLEPGHWQWNGVQYVWVGRHWIVRRPGYVHWIPGHWFRGPLGRWHWAAGHWGG